LVLCVFILCALTLCLSFYLFHYLFIYPLNLSVIVFPLVCPSIHPPIHPTHPPEFPISIQHFINKLRIGPVDSSCPWFGTCRPANTIPPEVMAKNGWMFFPNRAKVEPCVMVITYMDRTDRVRAENAEVAITEQNRVRVFWEGHPTLEYAHAHHGRIYYGWTRGEDRILGPSQEPPPGKQTKTKHQGAK